MHGPNELPYKLSVLLQSGNQHTGKHRLSLDLHPARLRIKRNVRDTISHPPRNTPPNLSRINSGLEAELAIQPKSTSIPQLCANGSRLPAPPATVSGIVRSQIAEDHPILHANQSLSLLKKLSPVRIARMSQIYQHWFSLQSIQKRRRRKRKAREKFEHGLQG